MRLSPVVIGGTEQALREVLRFVGPADVTLSRFFRENPKLGSRGRGAIGWFGRTGAYLADARDGYRSKDAIALIAMQFS